MISMQDIFVQAAYAGAVLTIVAFIIGTWVHRKLQNAIANPVIIALLLVIAFLKFFDFG